MIAVFRSSKKKKKKKNEKCMLVTLFISWWLYCNIFIISMLNAVSFFQTGLPISEKGFIEKSRGMTYTE